MRIINTVTLILIFISISHAQADCICAAQVLGPETLVAGLPDIDVGAKIAANSLNGSYFVGWSSYRYSTMNNEEATAVLGQIFDRTINPISAPIIFEDNPSHIAGDPIFFGGVVFNARRREYFVVTANNAFTPIGAKYGSLRAHIVSDTGTLITSNIPVGDNRNFPASFFAANETEVLFNSVSREYVVKYTIFVSGDLRTVMQSFDEQGKRKRKAIFFRSGELRFDFNSNQYLFASSGIFRGIYEIKAQLLNAQLKRIGHLNTVLSVPYDGSNPYQFTGPFPVYNSARRRFVIFWYEGPWNNSKIFERSLAPDGTLERKVATGIYRRISEIRFNPVTAGYILIPRFSEVLRIDSSYRVTSKFSVTCQKPPAGNPFVVFNRFMREFLLVWFYPVASGKNIDLFGRRIAASIPPRACNP